MISPLLGIKAPDMARKIADLPESVGPSKPNTSPWRTSKDTLLITMCFPKDFVKFFTDKIGFDNF